MVKNQRGFSIPELLAVIMITSIIIVPLLTSMIDNIATNYILHVRRSSVSIADGTLYGFDKLSFEDIKNIQDDSNNIDGDFYSEFNGGDGSDGFGCNQLTINVNDETICNLIFGASFSNVNFDQAHFRVFIYDYNLIAARRLALYENINIPLEVREEILAIAPAPVYSNPGLLRITVWIQYNDDPLRTTVVSGLIIKELNIS